MPWISLNWGESVEIAEFCLFNVSQALGARVLNLGHTSVDAITCCGYKWLCGPYETGFCWLTPSLRDSLLPLHRYCLPCRPDDRWMKCERLKLRTIWVLTRGMYFVLPIFSIFFPGQPVCCDRIWRGTTQERDRRARGARSRSRLSGRYGAPRSVLAGRHRIGDRDSGGDWSRISHVQPAFRGCAVESVAAGRCGCASRIGGARCGGDPGAEGSKHRPDPGAPQGVTQTGSNPDQRQAENGNVEVFGGDLPCAVLGIRKLSERCRFTQRNAR